jgi:hypothetical protein
MNARELRLLVALALILGGGGGAIIFYQWFYKPLVEYNATIKRLTDERDKKQAQLEAIWEDRKLLEAARLMSLSPSPGTAMGEYDRYLSSLLKACELEVHDFKSIPATEVKGSSGQQGSAALKPGHQIIGFQVKAEGDLFSLVKVLETMQKTPMVHRIKSLTIDPVDQTGKTTSDQLNIAMTVESLIVSKAETRIDGPLAPERRLVAFESLLALNRAPTGLSLLGWLVGPTGPLAQRRLAMESGYRIYSDMRLKNIFTGPVDPPKATPEPDAGIMVTEFVRLDTTDREGKEAFFRNLVFKTPPLRVRSIPGSGYDTFRIMNELKTHTVLKAKVLRIDQRDVYFQVQEDVYGIHMGQSLADAMRRPLSDMEMEGLGLSELYDAEWGATEAKDALETATKQKKRGR